MNLKAASNLLWATGAVLVTIAFFNTGKTELMIYTTGALMMLSGATLDLVYQGKFEKEMEERIRAEAKEKYKSFW